MCEVSELAGLRFVSALQSFLPSLFIPDRSSKRMPLLDLSSALFGSEVQEAAEDDNIADLFKKAEKAEKKVSAFKPCAHFVRVNP